jgi:hypothetical protein
LLAASLWRASDGEPFVSEARLLVRYARRFENGHASMDLSARTLRCWSREEQELVLEAAHKISGKPIEVLRREMLFGGLRLIRGGKV